MLSLWDLEVASFCSVICPILTADTTSKNNSVSSYFMKTRKVNRAAYRILEIELIEAIIFWFNVFFLVKLSFSIYAFQLLYQTKITQDIFYLCFVLYLNSILRKWFSFELILRYLWEHFMWFSSQRSTSPDLS